MRILPELFRFVSLTQRLYNIDESHGLTHSMDVFLKADEIYRHEVSNYQYLEKQKHIIDTAAITHDLCDIKYMNKAEGISRIRYFLNDKLPLDDIDTVTDTDSNRNLVMKMMILIATIKPGKINKKIKINKVII